MCSLVNESAVVHRVSQVLGAPDRTGKLPLTARLHYNLRA
jgi:hypothetical protein